jgi:hypothetical protein
VRVSECGVFEMSSSLHGVHIRMIGACVGIFTSRSFKLALVVSRIWMRSSAEEAAPSRARSKVVGAMMWRNEPGMLTLPILVSAEEESGEAFPFSAQSAEKINCSRAHSLFLPSLASAEMCFVGGESLVKIGAAAQVVTGLAKLCVDAGTKGLGLTTRIGLLPLGQSGGLGRMHTRSLAQAFFVASASSNASIRCSKTFKIIFGFFVFMDLSI